MKQFYNMKATFSIDGGEDSYHHEVINNIKAGERIQLKFTDVTIEKQAQKRYGKTKDGIKTLMARAQKEGNLQYYGVFEQILNDFDDDFKVEGHVDDEPEMFCTECKGTFLVGATRNLPCPKCCGGNDDEPKINLQAEHKLISVHEAPKCGQCEGRGFSYHGGVKMICDCPLHEFKEFEDEPNIGSLDVSEVKAKPEPCPQCEDFGRIRVVKPGSEIMDCQVCRPVRKKSIGQDE